MAKKHQKHPHALANDPALAELIGAIRDLLTIEGVEGIGQPVMLLSLADLPSDVLGVVERLKGGCIEVGEEMLIVTLSRSSGRGGKRRFCVVSARRSSFLAAMRRTTVPAGRK